MLSSLTPASYACVTLGGQRRSVLLRVNPRMSRCVSVTLPEFNPSGQDGLLYFDLWGGGG